MSKEKENTVETKKEETKDAPLIYFSNEPIVVKKEMSEQVKSDEIDEIVYRIGLILMVSLAEIKDLAMTSK